MTKFTKIKKINKNIPNEDIFHLSVRNNNNFFGNDILLHNCSYRGELGVILFNSSHETFRIEEGMKIAQIVFQKIEQPEFILVDDLDSSSRGEGGFGSTGLK